MYVESISIPIQAQNITSWTPDVTTALLIRCPVDFALWAVCYPDRKMVDTLSCIFWQFQLVALHLHWVFIRHACQLSNKRFSKNQLVIIFVSTKIIPVWVLVLIGIEQNVFINCISIMWRKQWFFIFLNTVCIIPRNDQTGQSPSYTSYILYGTRLGICCCSFAPSGVISSVNG